MIELFLDTETYSETPIKHGTYKYAENAEVMIATYAINDGPVEHLDFTRGVQSDVWRLKNLVSNANVIICHNTMFDRNVLRLGNLKIEVPIEKFRCSMVKALLHGLPGGLDKLCDILGVPTDLAKHKTGRALIHLFCKPIAFAHAIPRADYPTVKAWKEAIEEAKKHWQGRATRETHPVQWAQFIEYARADIPAMREVWRRLPSWNYGETGAGALERDLWHLDQKINDRGVCIDLPLVHAAIRATNDEQTRLKSRVVAHTDGYVEAATQRDRMLEFIFTEYGIGLADLTKSTVTKLIEKEGTPPELVELLQLRAQASQTSTAKYNAFARGTSADGRLRGMLQFSGAARTRRDCLAEGTLVLVRDPVGTVFEKPIQNVLLSDEVWDGDAWVAHEGVVFSGEKEVMTYDGVTATLAHNVYLDADTSVTLEEAIKRGDKLWRGTKSFTEYTE